MNWPRSTMDSIRVSEAPDPSSILGEATHLAPISDRRHCHVSIEFINLKNNISTYLNSVKTVYSKATNDK
jgi:hypothetical protein